MISTEGQRHLVSHRGHPHCFTYMIGSQCLLRRSLTKFLLIKLTTELATLLTVLLSTSVIVTEEFCQDETFHARCRRPDDVILVLSATYGRPRLGRCVRRNLGYLGCAVDALPVLDSRCSGRQAASSACRLSIMDPGLRRLSPCPIDVTWHLEVTYSCLEGMSNKYRERFS